MLTKLKNYYYSINRTALKVVFEKEKLTMRIWLQERCFVVQHAE